MGEDGKDEDDEEIFPTWDKIYTMTNILNTPKLTENQSKVRIEILKQNMETCRM